jgi:hypothetical protein
MLEAPRSHCCAPLQPIGPHDEAPQRAACCAQQHLVVRALATLERWSRPASRRCVCGHAGRPCQFRGRTRPARGLLTIATGAWRLGVMTGIGDARSRADLRHGPKVASLSGERDEPAFRIGRSQLRGELSLAHVGWLAAPHQCRASSHEFGLRPRSAEERCWSISIRVPISIGPSVRLRSGCWIIKTPDLGLRARVGRQGHRGEYGPTTGWRAALLRHAARQINLTSGDRQSSLTA